MRVAVRARAPPLLPITNTRATSGTLKFSYDGMLGLAMTDIPDYPTPFTKSVCYFICKK